MTSAMAAGRGEFFRSLWEGFERQYARPQPLGPRPGSGRGRPGPGAGQAVGRKKQGPRATPGAQGSFHKFTRDAQEESVPQRNASSSEDNVVERLPCEILIKILSHLDAASLFCISHVSKLFHRLANDDVMWEKIYMSEFGNEMWKLKLDKEAPVEVRDESAGHWKKMYIRAVAGQEVIKWSRKLRDISPYTGLPRQTEWVLRKQSVSWELTVCDSCGRRSTLEQSYVYFSKSSVIVCWGGDRFLNYHQISNIQLYGVRKENLKSLKKPDWRSLILKLDVAQCGRFIGKDRLIKLIHLQPGFVIALWRGQGSVAFIMASLHFHKLVEKSLLGSPVCPYSEAVDRPPVDHSDPGFGLRGYTLHFVLHNTGTEIMSGHFYDVSCHAAQVQQELVELRIIERTNLSQHRSLSGHVKLPWKSEGLEGSVENCCIMTLTLLDDFQKPFWCVSSPVTITMAKKPLSFDYRGEHYLMAYYQPDGHVKMNLVWLEEQKQFFVISLTLYISVFKVNKHFSRGLKS